MKWFSKELEIMVWWWRFQVGSKRVWNDITAQILNIPFECATGKNFHAFERKFFILIEYITSTLLAYMRIEKQDIILETPK